MAIEMLEEAGVILAERRTAELAQSIANARAESQSAPKTARIDPSALKIESGIALPELEPVFKRSAWPELLAKMAVGDSIFIEGGTIAKYAYVRAIAKKQDITVTFRKSQHGVRMWRIATPVVDDDGL